MLNVGIQITDVFSYRFFLNLLSKQINYKAHECAIRTNQLNIGFHGLNRKLLLTKRKLKKKKRIAFEEGFFYQSQMFTNMFGNECC